jgi:hypothetical protein
MTATGLVRKPYAGLEGLRQPFLRARLRPLRCSISQRPAGPGGASLRYTARIGVNDRAEKHAQNHIGEPPNIFREFQS